MKPLRQVRKQNKPPEIKKRLESQRSKIADLNRGSESASHLRRF